MVLYEGSDADYHHSLINGGLYHVTTTEELYDITIIGGGPTGLFAAFYGGLRSAKVKIIETLPTLGGQLAMLYPEKRIYDVAGFPNIKAQDLVDRLVEQTATFNPTICLEEEVLELNQRADETIELVTNKGRHRSKTVIITAGNGAFEPRRLDIANASALEGSQVHYYIKDMNHFADKNVAICGGGDSAVDWALMLEPIAKSVSLIHRRDAFRAHESSVQQLQDSSVTLMTPYVPATLTTDDDGNLTHVGLKKMKTAEESTVAIDHFIVNYGFISTLGPIKTWELELQKNVLVVNSKMETNRPGIYAAGDVCTYPGKVALIVTGLGEAPTAVNNAMNYINPKTRVQPMHSTSMFGQ